MNFIFILQYECVQIYLYPVSFSGIIHFEGKTKVIDLLLYKDAHLIEKTYLTFKISHIIRLFKKGRKIPANHSAILSK